MALSVPVVVLQPWHLQLVPAQMATVLPASAVSEWE
jgi:hypothetical protein